jgi:hypothetical protein
MGGLSQRLLRIVIPLTPPAKRFAGLHPANHHALLWVPNECEPPQPADTDVLRSQPISHPFHEHFLYGLHDLCSFAARLCDSLVFSLLSGKGRGSATAFPFSGHSEL